MGKPSWYNEWLDYEESRANAWLCDNDLKEEKGTTYEGEQHDTGNAEPF